MQITYANYIRSNWAHVLTWVHVLTSSEKTDRFLTEQSVRRSKLHRTHVFKIIDVKFTVRA